MSWESTGYGIHPFQGNKAPNIDVGYQDNKTLFQIVMPEKMEFKQVEELAQKFFELGKQALTK